MIRSSILASVVMISPLMAPTFVMAQDSNADTVVATVNDETITLGQMIVMKESIQDPNMSKMPAEQLWDLLLDQLVRQTAVASNGKENAGARAQTELQRRGMLAAQAISDVSESKPSDDDIQAAYDKMFKDAEPQTEYSAAHILVETEETAKDLKAQIDEGADFGKLAEENSTGPTGPNKGDLGWFTADQMVPEFSEVVKSLEKGKVSDPVKTEFGWHVIKLNDSRVQEAPTMDEIRPQLEQMVLREKVEAEVERLTSEAKIEKTEGIDPELINKAELLEAE